MIPGDRVRDRTNPWARWSSVYGIVTAVNERVHVDWWLPGMTEPFATGIHTPQRLEVIAW